MSYEALLDMSNTVILYDTLSCKTMCIFTKWVNVKLSEKWSVKIMFKVRADYDEYQNKTFRIPTELVQELEMVAQANNISVNKLVIQSLQYALDNLDEGSKSGK